MPWVLRFYDALDDQAAELELVPGDKRGSVPLGTVAGLRAFLDWDEPFERADSPVLDSATPIEKGHVTDREGREWHVRAGRSLPGRGGISRL